MKQSRLSQEAIREAIAKMNASDDIKKEVQRQCDRGSHSVLFYIEGLIKRQNANT